MGDSVFQAQVLTPDLVERVVQDDSPEVFYEKFWAFFGIDIPIAYIEPWDFMNILDMVDIKFLTILDQFSEYDWDMICVIEREKYSRTIKNVYVLVELWEDVKAKIYLKMCRARAGFNLRALTENISKVEQNIKDNSIGKPNAQMMSGTGSGNEKYAKSKGWSLW